MRNVMGIFCGLHFQMHFLEWKLSYLDQNFTGLFDLFPTTKVLYWLLYEKWLPISTYPELNSFLNVSFHICHISSNVKTNPSPLETGGVMSSRVCSKYSPGMIVVWHERNPLNEPSGPFNSILTHWKLNKMATFVQTFAFAFSLKKIRVF